MGIKQYVKDWMSEKWDQWVKQPITNKTIQAENQVKQKWNEYSGKAKEQAGKPLVYYKNQDAFYRGLFWIGVGLLIILWILSGS